MAAVNDNQNKQQDSRPAPVIRVWALAGEVGLLIVIPLLIFLFIGIRLDRAAGTEPLFIIVSLILSFIVSTVAIWRKIKKIQNIQQGEGK